MTTSSGTGEAGARRVGGAGARSVAARDDGRVTLAKIRGHFLTITRHKLLVMRHCFAVGLYRQGLAHDLSKYSLVEFRTGARYFQGDRSPNAAEREARGYSEAWLHHKGRNRHHFEYWVDMRGNGDATLEGKPMPTRYVVEMFCDRVAACKVYKGAAYTDRSALEYFQFEQSHGFLRLMHPDTAALLERLLRMLAQDGERETFRAIREQIVRPRSAYGDGIRF